MMWDLVADIGGTNMRVAQVHDGAIVSRRDFAMSPDRLVAQTLKDVARDLGGTPNNVVAAGAGPVRGGEIRLTNGGWLVSESEILDATGAKNVRVINDFEAAAWSLATLESDHVQPIGNSGPLSSGHRVAVGPGTGLGVGSLFWDGQAYHVMPGEGGHVAIGPRCAAEIPIFEAMSKIWPEAQIKDTFTFEAEALLSGTGLPYLYQACGGAAGIKGREVFARAIAGEPAAVQCRAFFAHHLAALCGDIAVTLRATGGIFLLGGVAQANSDLFDEAFWANFSEGGRPEFTALRSGCGIYLMKLEDFGLRGCVNALSQDISRKAPHA